MQRLSRSLGAGVAAALLVHAAAAQGDDKRECLSEFDEAQQLRIDGKLRAARERLLVCSADRCPAPVRKDCAQWTTEVMAAIPTVVFGARDAQGHDVPRVRVVVDGIAVVERLDGEPVPLDPGAHTFRFESANAPPVEQQAIVRAGEKNRAITVTLTSAPAGASPAVPPPPPPTSTSPPGATSPEPPPDAGRASAGPSPLAWVFAGVGVAALGASLGLELSVKSDADGLRASCGAAGCTTGQVAPLRTRQVLAGVALGAGLASLGVSAFFFFVRPTPQGATVGAVARF